ncbi:ATP-grasp domain-containing protein [Tumebacillus sp. ITR2]|uniref:ATP-grasp domain-containing protein n=1 Tax=Tumebacillus amylolyticus TaxID=2801339 RepID=A0ABS1JGC7_9BACL|nr:ATP-grasp domain-containing protein [Tumebacillus amylolyticus]MBL0389292.1 ATP-grasp domain-containing protein [Tumebacillus amylolyticus]
MKIGIMGWDYEEFESLNLVEAGVALGHEMLLFTLQDVQFTTRDGRNQLSANGRDLAELDVVISRAQVRPEHWASDCERYQLMQEAGLFVIDPADDFITSESKLLTMHRLTEAGLQVPDTFQCNNVSAVRELAAKYGTIVVKPSYGYAGQDVERVTGDFEKSAPLVQSLLSQYGDVLVQPFIPHPEGDFRTTVVGDEILFTIRRIPNEKTWKANLAMGATFEEVEVSDEIREVTMRAVQAMGITIAGLDILAYDGKYYLLEVNNVPGWYFFEPERRFAVSKHVIQYAVNSTLAHRDAQLTPEGV